jgi:uroporphyrinogen decarboxylase
MDSRERVWRAVKREGPDRPPRDLWLLPATRPALGPGLDTLLDRWPRDIAMVGFPQWPRAGGLFQAGQTTDDWGSVWSNVREGLLGMVTGFPLGDDAAFDSWRPPFDAIGPATEHLPRFIAENSGGTLKREQRAGERFRLGGGIELFHRMCWLRPMDKIMMDMLVAPERFERLLSGVAAFFDSLLERLLALDLDGVHLMDDWGTQRALFISPDLWRAHFKPHYRRWAAEIHRAGKLCFMHSDGQILSIIPDLAEIGIDVLNCEVDCMGLERVAAARGRTCQWGEVDRQNLLPRGTPEEVAAAARRFLDVLNRPEGGVILQSEIGPDVPLANVAALLGEWGLEPA